MIQVQNLMDLKIGDRVYSSLFNSEWKITYTPEDIPKEWLSGTVGFLAIPTSGCKKEHWGEIVFFSDLDDLWHVDV